MHAQDVLAAEKALGVTIEDGDAVLLHSGHMRRRAALGAWNPDGSGAGLHVDVMPLLARRGIALLGGDGDSDVRPSPVVLLVVAPLNIPGGTGSPVNPVAVL